MVGNARSLGETQLGAAINAAGLVIRLNAAPMPGPASHGTRTDWLAMSVPVPEPAIVARAPEVLLWMPSKRRRLPWRIARREGFHLNPAHANVRLRAELGAPATTGLMLIDLLARSKMARADLFGFDFFASKSLSGRRDAAQVPHDFDAEHDWVERLLGRDRRFSLRR
nr:glycosyltransferase family 29 protein [Limimaricola litoreus]